MTFAISTDAAIEELGRDPLRHVVLLKQLLAYPAHAKAYRASGVTGTAILLALEASASAYDRQTYPEADVVAFISSDHPDLTASLLSCLPSGIGIVFKLSHEADLPPVDSRFSVTRRTAFVSFTDGLRRLPTENHVDHVLSTERRQAGILMHVHPAPPRIVDVSTTSASSAGAGWTTY
jgi:hypothetical protein